jgi:hypothetical protein
VCPLCYCIGSASLTTSYSTLSLAGWGGWGVECVEEKKMARQPPPARQKKNDEKRGEPHLGTWPQQPSRLCFSPSQALPRRRYFNAFLFQGALSWHRWGGVGLVLLPSEKRWRKMLSVLGAFSLDLSLAFFGCFGIRSETLFWTLRFGPKVGNFFQRGNEKRVADASPLTRTSARRTHELQTERERLPSLEAPPSYPAASAPAHAVCSQAQARKNKSKQLRARAR